MIADKQVSDPSTMTALPEVTFVPFTFRPSIVERTEWWNIEQHPNVGAAPLLYRCMREYYWDKDYAIRVLHAYRQFLELKRILEDWDAEILAPSQPVGQMWHMHILDVNSYCLDCLLLCGRVVGNDPDGTLDEWTHQKKIAQTKQLLKARFENRVDKEIWSFPAVEGASEDGVSDGSDGNDVNGQKGRSKNQLKMLAHKAAHGRATPMPPTEPTQSSAGSTAIHSATTSTQALQPHLLGHMQVPLPIQPNLSGLTTDHNGDDASIGSNVYISHFHREQKNNIIQASSSQASRKSRSTIGIAHGIVPSHSMVAMNSAAAIALKREPSGNTMNGQEEIERMLTVPDADTQQSVNGSARSPQKHHEYQNSKQQHQQRALAFGEDEDSEIDDDLISEKRDKPMDISTSYRFLDTSQTSQNIHRGGGSRGSRFQEEKKEDSVAQSTVRDMDIRIRTLRGLVYMFSVHTGMTVGDVKNMIFQQHRIPQSCQNLLLHGKVLEDKKTLGYYKIQPETGLQLVARPRRTLDTATTF